MLVPIFPSVISQFLKIPFSGFSAAFIVIKVFSAYTLDSSSASIKFNSYPFFKVISFFKDISFFNVFSRSASASLNKILIVNLLFKISLCFNVTSTIPIPFSSIFPWTVSVLLFIFTFTGLLLLIYL